MSMAENVLSPRKRAFVEALLLGKTQAEAGQAVGVSDRQARRYMFDPTVRATLRAAQDDALAQVTRRAVAVMTDALDKLAEIMRDGNVAPSARVAAARAILENGLRFHDAVTLAERVATLEDYIKEKEKEQDDVTKQD